MSQDTFTVRTDGRNSCRVQLYSRRQRAFATIIFGLCAGRAFAQCDPGQKLTASDATAGERLGNSVSVSGDSAIFGAPYDECAAGNNCGSAYVFRSDGTSWVEEQKLTASDARIHDNFGWSVSVSGDTAVVGAWLGYCAAGGCGSAYLYRFDGTSWVEEKKLTARDAAGGEYFGSSVSVDGDHIVVGAPFDDCAAGDRCGSAYVFRFNGTFWVEQKLTTSVAAANEFFGSSVSVSGDTIVVGTLRGAAYVFHFNGRGWIEEQRLPLGSSVSVSGYTIMLGAPGRSSLYVYGFDGTDWVAVQELRASDAATNESLGSSVSVSGYTAVVGAHNDDCPAGFDCGAAYVFRFDGNSWVEEQKLSAFDGMAGDQFGWSVSVSGDSAVVGARLDECAAGLNCGSAYVFDCPTSCGNVSLDPGEECDGGIHCTDCVCDRGFEPSAPPTPDCQPVCGNGVLDPGEECDDGSHCTDCSCDSRFEPTVPPSLDCQLICGNGSLDTGEECDGGLDCTDCHCDAGFESTVPFSLDCQPICGNGSLDPGEECDQTDDAACPGACLGDCTCGPFCGDGTCDPSEDSCSCTADCGVPSSSELPGSTCTDGLDNDCDGIIDSDDPDCPVIPTTSLWGMLFLTLLLLATGKIVFRRTASSSGSARRSIETGA